MGTYSAEWATKVYYAFVEVCPRAHQIDACIIQTIRQEGWYNPTHETITAMLVYALTKKGNKLWYQYKQLCKRPSFDVRRLYAVSDMISHLIVEVDVKQKQRQLWED